MGESRGALLALLHELHGRSIPTALHLGMKAIDLFQTDGLFKLQEL